MFALEFFTRRAGSKTWALLALLCVGWFTTLPAHAAQKTYATPEAAIAALVDAARSGSSKKMQAVFGPEAKQLGSGDAVMAKRERERFVLAYEEKHSIRMQGDSRITLVLGSNEWPFPVPLVKNANGWRFDTLGGKEEIIDRRIGRNELYTIQVLLAMVDAQREYAAQDRDGDGVREYAQKFSSSPGKQDGLYWPTRTGETPSPLGALAAHAVREGYAGKSSTPAPYWGYYYRILNGQGSRAKGGAYSYLVKQDMIGGFAILAYPAQYGASGIKSFIVNHDGQVYEKDLGSDTPKQAAAMHTFNPDDAWSATQGLSLSQ